MSVDTDIPISVYDQLRAELYEQLRTELLDTLRPVNMTEPVIDTVDLPVNVPITHSADTDDRKCTAEGEEPDKITQFRVMMFITNRTCRIGGALTYEQAELICDDLFKALVEPGLRLSVYIEEDC